MSIKKNEYCIGSVDFYKVDENGHPIVNADGSHKTYEIKDLDFTDPKYSFLLHSGSNLNDNDMAEVITEVTIK
jgi:hypothetical protein